MHKDIDIPDYTSTDSTAIGTLVDVGSDLQPSYQIYSASEAFSSSYEFYNDQLLSYEGILDTDMDISNLELTLANNTSIEQKNSNIVVDTNNNGYIDAADFEGIDTPSLQEFSNVVSAAYDSGSRFFALGEFHFDPNIEGPRQTLNTLYEKGERRFTIYLEQQQEQQPVFNDYFSNKLSDGELLEYLVEKKLIAPNEVAKQLKLIKEFSMAHTDTEINLYVVNQPPDLSDGYGEVSTIDPETGKESDVNSNDRDDRLRENILENFDPKVISLFIGGANHTSKAPVYPSQTTRESFPYPPLDESVPGQFNKFLPGSSPIEEHDDVNYANPLIKQLDEVFRTEMSLNNNFLFSIAFLSDSIASLGSRDFFSERRYFDGYDVVFKAGKIESPEDEPKD